MGKLVKNYNTRWPTNNCTIILWHQKLASSKQMATKKMENKNGKTRSKVNLKK